MCGGSVSYESYSSPRREALPEVLRDPEVLAPVAPVLKQSRRINPNELAHQVAQYVNAKGEVTSHQGNSANPFETASISKTLKKGSLTVSFEAARSSALDLGTSHVVVKKGRKVLLEANGDSTLNFTDAKYTPGSWTKPFRAFDTSEMDAI